ncbi:hypothetical protein ElyMa_005064900 [Elysia marginata]|uniref:Uncharacterized protein n=1 Tax=Elysia marginata TaxID=1093978 RepID=A0AAV4JJL5_9GAST|nr:hypothetical protein ElyMa_005064900 [Elysia marginata]
MAHALSSLMGSSSWAGIPLKRSLLHGSRQSPLILRRPSFRAGPLGCLCSATPSLRNAGIMSMRVDLDQHNSCDNDDDDDDDDGDNDDDDDDNN